MKVLTEAPRLLTSTEARLLQWGLTEGQAVALAASMNLTPASTDAEIEQAVILAMVSAKEATSGRAQVLYLGGQRRDTLRGQ